MRRFLLAGLLLVALSTQALSQILMTGIGEGGSPGNAAYVGPGDIALSAGTIRVWGGFRAFSRATAGNAAAGLLRASGTATCYGVAGQSACAIKSLLTGAFDAASAASFCSGTTCKVVILYDQTGLNTCSGNPCDISVSTGAGQPYNATACGGSPGMTFAAADASAGPFPAVSQPFTTIQVAGRTGDTSSYNPTIGGLSNTSLYYNNSPGSLLLYAGSIGSPAVAVTENALHSLTGVLNGNSSAIILDGVSTAVSGIGASGLASGNFVFGSTNYGSFTGNVCEMGYIDAAISGADGAAISANQHGPNGYNF